MASLPVFLTDFFFVVFFIVSPLLMVLPPVAGDVSANALEETKGQDGGGDDQFAQEPAELCVVVVARQGVRRDAMDWRSAMVRTEPTHETLDDGGAYAAGWTISGLATLGTIIAVWMFAI